MMKHSFSPFCILLNLLSPIIPDLHLRIVILLEHKIDYILETLVFFENVIIML